MADKKSIKLKNYGSVESNTKSIQEYTIDFYHVSAENEPSETKLTGYGYYSVIPQDDMVGRQFKLYRILSPILSDELSSSDYSNNDSMILDSSLKKDKSINEFFPDVDYGFIFSECKNLDDRKIRLRLETDDETYESGDIIIDFSHPDKEKEQLDMIKIIWQNMPLLLISVFQNSPLSVYLDEKSATNSEVTIDTKIELIRRCIKIYHSQYSSIRKARKYRLSRYNYVDSIDKLNSVNSDTLVFISRNPQYLAAVNRIKGVKYKNKVYLPLKTLISKNTIDYDIYENRYIISFIKLLILECQNMKIRLKLLEMNANNLLNHASLKSKKNAFEVLSSRCQRQLNDIDKLEKNLLLISKQYENIFPLKNISAKLKKPKATAIFRQLKEYNFFLKGAFEPWFSYCLQPDIGDLLKSNGEYFYTAVSNPSTTYELYIVTSWIQFFIEEGYAFDYERASYAGIKEKEGRYSEYAYQFVFYKDEKNVSDSFKNHREQIILYYSPCVYYNLAGNYVKDSRLNVDSVLFRPTQNSMARKEDTEENSAKGSHYEPDFIIKYSKGIYDQYQNEFSPTIIRYLIADAKHKTFDNVRVNEMPNLMFKYLAGIKPFNPANIVDDNGTRIASNTDIRIAGLCAIYNDDIDRSTTEGVEYREMITNSINAEEEQFTRFLYMNVSDSDGWKASFKEILSMLKNFGKRKDLLTVFKKLLITNGTSDNEFNEIINKLKDELYSIPKDE